jgi:diguanylate cyclase
VLPGQSGSHATERSLVARIHAAISTQPMQLDAQTTLAVTCSFGAALALPREAASAAAIIDRADQALYRAKRAGRDRVEFAAG